MTAMQLDLSCNYFELFGMPVGFQLDQNELQSRWQTLQRSLHPDRFSSATDAEKRLSMQAASFVNEAHKVLRSPLSRAVYLLQLNDVDIDAETDTQMDPEFLMEQMELREALESIRSVDDPLQSIDNMREKLAAKTEKQQLEFQRSMDTGDLAAARDCARQWQFLEKLARELSDAEATLDE